MSGWEAMQQGAPDPFFPKESREPQLLGTGLTIDPCAECKHASFCSLAGACLRQKART